VVAYAFHIGHHQLRKNLTIAVAQPGCVAGFAGPTGSGYEQTAGCSGIWDRGGATLAEVGVEVDQLARAELRATMPGQ
jgi:hypothetical protein